MDWSAANRTAVLAGFIIWWTLAPRMNRAGAFDRLLAYLTAMMVLLIATAELIAVKPVPFYFMVGGGLAFFYQFSRLFFRIAKRGEE